MKRVFLVVFLVCSMMWGAQAMAAEKVKIGVIDIQRIIRDSKAGKEARAKFAKEIDSRKKILSAKEEKVKSMAEEIKKNVGKLTPAQRREKEEQMAQEVKELRRLKADLEEEIKKKEAEITSMLIRDILDEVRKLGSVGGYTLILDRKQGVVYFKDSIDCSPLIIERLK
ncbi:MAG TPA: OmpH family outer membrane protein [Syntrophaceae bacterium]|nr:OmpH family outer membrane protein [Syntrophaceae bacterium]